MHRLKSRRRLSAWFEPLEQRRLLAALTEPGSGSAPVFGNYCEAADPRWITTARGATTFGSSGATAAVVYGPQQPESPRAMLPQPSNTSTQRVAEAEGALPVVSIADADIVEGDVGGSTLSFEVTLSAAASEPVTVQVQAFNETASAFHVQRIASGLSEPVFVTVAPGDSDSLFIVEQDGVIKKMSRASGVVASTPFLTAGDLSTGGERGLLGLAFDPEYESNGTFYVNQTNAQGNTRVFRYQSNPDGQTADPGSRTTVIGFSQPFSNHNGGWIAFGPDGYLYIATGDGGSGNDPQNNGQDLTDNLLGKLLRIDVNGDDFPADPERNYSVPASNPFVGVTGDDEIWAYGLRNPWRNSFDALTGDLYIADVGQNILEEINRQPGTSSGGENYGWRLREGTEPTPTVGGPKPVGAIDPIYQYEHGTASNEGFSVTGGYLYRGPIDSLRGQYFFADYVRGRVWSIRPQADVPENYDGTNYRDFTDWTSLIAADAGDVRSISSFGEDEAGNLYVVDRGGEVFRFTEGADYVPTTQTLVFDVGQTTKSFQVTVIGDRLPEADETFRVDITQVTGAMLGQSSATGVINDDDVPGVERVELNGGATQRSHVDQLVVTFDGIVDLDLSHDDAFQVTDQTSGGSVDVSVAVSTATGKTQATLTFAGPLTESRGEAGTTLKDGQYELRIDAARVSAAGKSLDGNGDGVGGDDYRFGAENADAFFRLFGDVDGDRDVDGQDFGRFGRTYLQPIESAAFDGRFDFDGDGDVDGQDYGQFSRRFFRVFD
ncbi:hypothetical protein FYK55_15995 [Roseiconus nitratireducens]|uniref:Uncharacterized protein n=1 Tax=Roseiconus nitratireducens TaxID=2605748 RepID=A0A5M6D8R0_9BACT|nr:PQQ-dependent sugar dehydrogenase [Roseiconus nitratireducens]KAA5542299.1 hypothetical protein FYK55_15995 [Roseiconus nitratireducens]